MRIKQIALPFIVAILSLCMLYTVVILTTEPPFENWGIFGDSFGALNTLFSACAFTGVIITFLLQQRQEHAIQLTRTIEAFQSFRDERMLNSRGKAWEARQKWMKSEIYREAVTNHLLERNPGPIEIFSPAHDRVEEGELSAIFDMLEFYSMLAHLPGNDKALGQFTFYFAWWRGFLIDFTAHLSAEYAKVATTKEEKGQFPTPCWSIHLKELERRMNLPPYAREHHPLDRALVEGKPTGPQEIAETLPEPPPTEPCPRTPGRIGRALSALSRILKRIAGKIDGRYPPEP